MAEKLFYSMGEVAEMFDVNQSLIRHWESQFRVLQPKRNKKGNRLFSPQDVETLKLIYHLVKERGMTLDGARKAIGRRPQTDGRGVDRDAELMERLQRIRAMLVEVREDLREEPAAERPAGPAAAVAGAGAGAVEVAAVGQAAVVGTVEVAGVEPVVAVEPAAADPAAGSVAGSAAAEAPKRRGRKAVVRIPEQGAEEAAAAEGGEASRAAKTAPRRGRRRKDDGGDKELFAFYEQSLF